jgi:hypothetical protein
MSTSNPMPGRQPDCPQDLDLERALAGESAFAPALAHAGGCASCAERLTWMRAAGEQFTRRVFPATREAVLQAIHRPPFWTRLLRAWPVAIPAVAAALLAVLVIPRLSPPDGYVGTKGNRAPAPLALQVFVDRSGKAHQLLPGEHVHPGDGLRFVVDAPEREVVLLSLDARGNISRLIPSGTARIPATGIVPGGSVLDDVLGPERIFAVELQPGMGVAEVESAIRHAVTTAGERGVREAGALSLPTPQGTLLLEKVAP